MNIIFAIYGASGAGKSTLLEVLSKIHSNISIHQKDTTRRPDKSEINLKGVSDLNFISEEEFQLNNKKSKYIASYFKYNNYYGIVKNQIDTSFRENKIHCIIVRDINSIDSLKKRYMNLKTIYLHIDPNFIPQRFQKRDRYDKEEREKRIKEEFNEYVNNSNLFDYTIVNFWEISNAVQQFQNLLNPCD